MVKRSNSSRLLATPEKATAAALLFFPMVYMLLTSEKKAGMPKYSLSPTRPQSPV